jgi:hypothetical protein
MQKDYYDMTDKEKLTYVLKDIGLDFELFKSDHVSTIWIKGMDSDIEFRFDKNDAYEWFGNY